MNCPHINTVVTSSQIATTADSIAALQTPSGRIAWFRNGHSDPWNHVEAAMALTICGQLEASRKAFQWLIQNQREDGSWYNYYLDDQVQDYKLDSNCVAYFATGVWHYYLATKNRSFLKLCWPTLCRAVEFVLSMQRDDHAVVWARYADSSPWDYALLTGSSSIAHSLSCACSIAAVLEQSKPHWLKAGQNLANTIRFSPEVFEPKQRWAMDWYYPVLCGIYTSAQAEQHLLAGWDNFIVKDKGVRCVSDEPWVTAAETAECAIAFIRAGRRDLALKLFSWAQRHRCEDGSYYTGIVYPEAVTYPERERSSYTSAAIVLAADALQGLNPTAALFNTDLFKPDLVV